MVSADGQTVLVFNGEIYNHLEVRRELEQRGHKFGSRSDTETVLEAFLEWDVECFARLRGMFAAGFWNEARKRLVLARDRMGIKPLYVARNGRDLYFGSELKTLFAHPEIGRELDRAALDLYLSLNYVAGGRTLVAGIEKLAPGSWLDWREGAVQTGRYWHLPAMAPKARQREEAVAELDSLLRESVKEHLLSDVPLGVWLSGGLDSSTVLHYAAEAGASPQTFSISFRGRSFDETTYIREVAKQYGSEHHELDLNPDLALADTVEEFAYYSDEPSADAGALPVWFLSKLTKQNATVALSGEGADEVFGGYLTYRANALARICRHLPAGVLRAAGAAARQWPVSDEKIGFDYKLRRFLEGCAMAPERAHMHWNGAFSELEKRALVEGELPDAMADFTGELHAAGEGLGAYLRFDQKYYLADDILNKSDRMSMAHAVEVRPPFLDHRIVEFAATLPDNWKVDGKRQKVILREVMRNRLPPRVLQRSKVGFDIPAHEWLRGPLKPLLLDTLGSAGEHRALFHPGAVEKVLRDHQERRANLGYHLWGLLILILWMKKWKIQTGPAETPALLRENILTST
jgi:asparagine synthase (glutamine-hydrolysing)